MSLDLSALFLTFKLASVVTLVLAVIGTPLAWWLARSRSRLRPFVEALTALPLVLPPTVLGFYLLIFLNPNAPLGGLWVTLTGESLTFSFTGLVIASCLYSLPFMVQPLQSAFTAIGDTPIEAAQSVGASKLDAFFTVVAPLSKRGFLTAGILTFAHTVGEFGVVLMVGGNITGRTKVISIAIYEHVETLRYAEAHALSAFLLVFSFLTLLAVYTFNRTVSVRLG